MSPRFLFRLEQAPPNVVKTAAAYRISDQELASRLSFFIWGAGPDADLMKAANAGALHTSLGLEKQVRRMLADKRSEALSTRFASQWLRLQDLEKMIPDYLLFPQYDETLAQAMTRETELFFDSIVREDRNVLDLLTADYTFVNERLAKHYGIPNVTGNQFQRVTVPEYRRGLLGQGAILVSTSVADRTSPVLRGKWVMDVLLGTPPPPPPPNVPALDDSVKANEGGTMLSTRQRMEEHRKNPTCNACHRFIDPLGLSLENFDATGAWRIKDNEVAVDVVGDLVRRHEDRWSERPSRRAAAPPGHGAPQLRGKPDDLRDRPSRRVHGHARRARDCARRGQGQQQAFGVRAGYRQQPGVPHGEA